MEQGLNSDEWLERLSLMGSHLAACGKTVKLCAIGSVPLILQGMAGRSSVDLDVWVPVSKFNPTVLRGAAEAAGLDYNPVCEIQDSPYIQMVSPGIVQLGGFVATTVVFDDGHLTISVPPVANYIASKLLRADAKDVGDIAFLLSRNPAISKKSIEDVIRTFPRGQRESALENSVFLDALGASSGGGR